MHTIGTEQLTENFKQISMSVHYAHCSAVEGNFAEFGTATGGTAECFALAMSYFRAEYHYSELAHRMPPRKLFLFDSFEGLPTTSNEADQTSPHVAQGVWRPGALRGITPQQLLEKTSAHIPKEDIMIFEGWFSDSMPRVPKGEKFAVVHIDCDLYESSIQVLEWLFSENRLNDGAVLLFDDWNCNRASPNFGERRAWREIVEKYKPDFSDGGDYSITGHKMIIHRS